MTALRNSPPRVLLLGKDGQVGWELQRSLQPLGDVIAVGRTEKTFCGDLTDLEGLTRTICQLRPEVVVNAAAYTAVDKAEVDQETAYLVNAQAVQAIGQAAAMVGAKVLHFSSDYVFNGSGTRPWTESDAPAPVSVYGHSKLEGERLLAQTCAQHIILRTSWVYAARGENFAKTMLKLAQEKEELQVVSDQWGAPTGADLLADVSAHVLRQFMEDANLAGTYHVAARGLTNWFDYAQHVIESPLRAVGGQKPKSTRLHPCTSEAFRRPAQRPANSRLDTYKLKAVFGVSLPPWQAGVDRMLAEILSL